MATPARQPARIIGRKPPKAGVKAGDVLLQESVGRKGDTRKVPVAKVDPSTGQAFESPTLMETPRGRARLLLEQLFHTDPAYRQDVVAAFRGLPPDQQDVIRLAIAEDFPMVPAGKETFGWSPYANELIAALEGKPLSPERLATLEDVVRTEGTLLQGSERGQALGPDGQQATESFPAGENISGPPDANARGMKDPGEPYTVEGTRRPQRQGEKPSWRRDKLDGRPYLRTNTEELRTQGGDTRKYSTQLVDVTRPPTPEELAAHRRAYLEAQIKSFSPDADTARLPEDFMVQVLEGRGLNPNPPEMPPIVERVPRRTSPGGDGTVGPQDYPAWQQALKFEAGDQARTSAMEAALEEALGPGFRDELTDAIRSGDKDRIRELMARQREALQQAELPRVPDMPYQTDSRRGYGQAARSMMSEQQVLADQADSLANGNIGVTDYAWRMITPRGGPDSPLSAGVKTPDEVADAIIDLMDPDRIPAGNFETWRAGIVDTINRRWFQPQGDGPVIRTREQAIADDVAFDAQGNPADLEMPPGPAYQGDLGDIPEEAGDLFSRKYNITGEGPGFTLLGEPRLLPGPRRGNTASVPQTDGVNELGNVGMSGLPQTRVQSQGSDPYPQGVDQYGRPISADPPRYRKKPKDVDQYPGAGGTETIEPGPVRPRQGVPSTPASADSAINYAYMRGKVVFLDPETGKTMAYKITERTTPNKIASLRQIVRSQVEQAAAVAASASRQMDRFGEIIGPAPQESLAVFDKLWPEGSTPDPMYYQVMRTDMPAPDSLETRLNAPPPSSTAAAPVDDPEEIAREMAAMRSRDAEAYARDKEKYGQFGITDEKRLLPGWVRRPDGQVARSRFGFGDEAEIPDGLWDDIRGDEADEGLYALSDEGDTWQKYLGDLTPIVQDDIPLLPNDPGIPMGVRIDHAVSILSDPNANAADLGWAQEQHRMARQALDSVTDRELRDRVFEEIVSPLDEAVALRNAPPGNVADDLDAADTAVDEEVSGPVGLEESAPAWSPSQPEGDLGEIEPEESIGLFIPTEDAPLAELAPTQAPSQQEVLDLSDDLPEEESADFVIPSPPETAPLADDALEAAASDLGPTPAEALQAARARRAQPSSPDSTKPQEPPKPVEAEANANADAQKAASDAEAEAAAAKAKEEEEFARQAQAAKAAEDAANAKPDEEITLDPDEGDPPTLDPADRRTWGQFAGQATAAPFRHVLRNKLRYAIGVPALLGATHAWNRMTEAPPHRGQPWGMGGGGGNPEDEVGIDTARVRRTLRQSLLDDPYQQQTLRRKY